MSNIVLWLPKQIFFAHYVMYIHLVTPRRQLDEAEQRIELMQRLLFPVKRGE
ncbi:uncharacterized protein NMK_1061 [Novimethylophilus kurashikiensis]|uniref:Uncharacterized protein n=1 Tax=Novimethylophilus kurashikiensis TaxID=1825523 RepID=A0A2R5F9Z5_9PROT|nr:uncharacterized protein NMK_1061 [Novimethylophilus kurashikiensis]